MHLLCCRFHPVKIQGEWLLFLKPEENGLGSLQGLANHTVDYVYSRVLGEHDNGRKRKERVASLMVTCEDGSTLNVQDHFLATATRLGIEMPAAVRAAHSGVTWMLTALDSHTEPQGPAAATALRQTIMKALQIKELEDECWFEYRIGTPTSFLV